MVLKQLVTGISSNPFSIVQAIEKIGPDATPVGNAAASNGYVAQVVGPSKIIMDTGYFPANTFLGPVRLDIMYYSSVTGSNVLTFEIWRKDETGYEEKVYTIDKQWYADISAGFGQGVGFNYYTANNEYRYIIKSTSANAAGTTVGVDFIRIVPMPVFNVGPKYQYSGTLANYGSPYAYAIDMGKSTCASAGSSGFTLNVTTGYDCRPSANVFISLAWENTTAGGTMPFVIISATTTTGFSVYFQNAAGTPMTGNITIHYNIMMWSELTKI